MIEQQGVAALQPVPVVRQRRGFPGRSMPDLSGLVGWKPDCLRRFGVELKHGWAALPTSVEAFRLRSPQARLPPAKGGAGFGEGVLQSGT